MHTPASDPDPDSLTLADGTPARLAVPCRRCGTYVHAPTSVRARLGPRCEEHEKAAARRAALRAQPGLFALPDPDPDSADDDPPAAQPSP